jgi:hypothetical protein
MSSNSDSNAHAISDSNGDSDRDANVDAGGQSIDASNEHEPGPTTAI